MKKEAADSSKTRDLPSRIHFCPEGIGIRFLQNIGSYLPDHRRYSRVTAVRALSLTSIIRFVALREKRSIENYRYNANESLKTGSRAKLRNVCPNM
jgi:hypothetical protein